jgi:hypothetical protein
MNAIALCNSKGTRRPYDRRAHNSFRTQWLCNMVKSLKAIINPRFANSQCRDIPPPTDSPEKSFVNSVQLGNAQIVSRFMFHGRSSLSNSEIPNKFDPRFSRRIARIDVESVRRGQPILVDHRDIQSASTPTVNFNNDSNIIPEVFTHLKRINNFVCLILGNADIAVSLETFDHHVRQSLCERNLVCGH